MKHTLHHDAHTLDLQSIHSLIRVMATSSKDAQTFYNVTRKRLLVRLWVTSSSSSSRTRSRINPFRFD